MHLNGQSQVSGRGPMNRRAVLRGMLGGLAAVGAASLAACSSDNDGPTGSATTGTRPFTNIQGDEISIPANPQRIAALSEPALDGLLALGVTPIGGIQGRGQPGVSSYLKDRAGAITLFGTVSEVNYEAIGAARPDLIITDGTGINNRPDVIDILSQIAPVAYTGWAGGPWRDNFRAISDAAGKTAEGDEVLNRINDRIGEYKSQLEQRYADKTFSIVRWQGNAGALILRELPAGSLLYDLGLHRPPNQDKEGPGHSVPVSVENMAELDADYMFFGSLGGSSVGNPNAGGEATAADSLRALEQAKTIPSFAALHAVQTNNVIAVDAAAWTSTGGPLMIEYLLDDVNSHLLR